MDMIALGAALRAARLNKGISQETLCASTRIARSTLSSLENGRIAEIGITKVMEVCAVLGLRITLEEAFPRPTLMQLVHEREKKVGVSTVTRMRAPRRIVKKISGGQL
jgi:transcriptional regulator with XRE-family HTH domain